MGSSKIHPVLGAAGFKDGKAITWNGIFGVMQLNALPEEFGFAIEWNKFSNLAGTYVEDEVELTHEEEKGVLYLDNKEGSKLRMACHKIDEYPWFDPDLEGFMEITSDDFMTALEISMTTTANDQSSGMYWGAYFGRRTAEDGVEISYIMSSDRHRISYFEVEHPFNEICLPRTYIETIIKMGKPDAILQDKKFVYFKYGDTILFGTTLGAAYPDMSKVFDLRHETIGVEEKVKLFAKRAAILGGVSINYDPKTKRLSSQTYNNDYIGEKVDLGENYFCVLTAHLIEALEHAKGWTSIPEPGKTFMYFDMGIPGFQMVCFYSKD